MAALARWCFRHRLVVVLSWVAAVVLLTGLDQGIGSKFSNNFDLPDTDSSRALTLLQQAFPAQSGDSDTIVLHARSGTLGNAALRTQATTALGRVATLPHVTGVDSPFVDRGASQISKDGTIAFATVHFDEAAQDLPVPSITRMVDTARAADRGGLEVQVGGNAVEQSAQKGTSASEGIGVLAAAVVLFLAFGSLLAMLLPLVTALVALGAGTAAIGLLTHVLGVASFGPQLATLIGLGVGVDYALFIVSRHRAELRRGVDVETSVVNALSTAGRAVLFAGITVCIALLGLFTVGISFLYGVAVSATVVVLLTMLAATTLLPALLGFLGLRVLSRKARRALAEQGPTRGDEMSPRWFRWGRFVERRPRLLTVVAAGVMVLLAVPFFALRLGSSDAGNDAAGTTTRKAYDLLAQGFGPGFNGPFTIVSSVGGAGDLPSVQAVADAVGKTRGVAAVTPPVLAPSGKVAIFSAYPSTAPQAKATTDLLSRLRNDVIPGTAAGSHTYVGGVTPIFADFASVISGKLPLFIGVVVLLAFLVLLAVFRSLLVPVVASVMNLLAAGGAFGVVVVVFQFGWFGDAIGGKSGPVEAFLPVLMFAILFGLSMDYEVFLVSRIHEEWLATRSNEQAVTRGQAETGQVITAAAAIMVLVFGSFVLGGERVIKEFGIGLAGAVLLDALIVRTVLVPALMHLLGKANWWLPRWLDRALPHIDLEGPSGARSVATVD